MEEVFYGVYIPPELLVGREEPVPTVYTDISSLNKVGQFILIHISNIGKDAAC